MRHDSKERHANAILVRPSKARSQTSLRRLKYSSCCSRVRYQWLPILRQALAMLRLVQALRAPDLGHVLRARARRAVRLLAAPELHEADLVVAASLLDDARVHCLGNGRLEQAASERAVLLAPAALPAAEARVGHGRLVVVLPVLGVRGAHGRAEAGGEEAGAEAAEGGHAHADDADVEFERGEDGGEDVVVEWVAAVGELGEGPEAGDGDGDGAWAWLGVELE